MLKLPRRWRTMTFVKPFVKPFVLLKWRMVTMKTSKMMSLNLNQKKNLQRIKSLKRKPLKRLKRKKKSLLKSLIRMLTKRLKSLKRKSTRRKKKRVVVKKLRLTRRTTMKTVRCLTCSRNSSQKIVLTTIGLKVVLP